MPTMINTDPLTIELIQSRAPALSKSDFEYIQEHMRPGGLLFHAVTDPTQRSDLTQRLLATEEMIPSLYTLIRDIRYLKQPAAILGTLLPKTRNKTLRQRYHFYFTEIESSSQTIEVQQSISSYTTISKTHLDSFDLSYQQLWLCAYRVCKYPSAYGQLQIATLAHRLGFSSTEIEQELTKDPDQVIIEKAVLEALHILRPNEKVSFDANQARQLIASFHDYIAKFFYAPAKSSPPLVTVSGSGEPLARRCGYSSADTQDLEHLFLEQVHAPLDKCSRGGDEISSFYVKRSRHRAFFGAVNLAEDQQGQSSNWPPTVASVEQGIVGVASHTDELTGLGSTPTAGGLELATQRSQDVVQDRQVVKFNEQGAMTLEVPREKEAVNRQARIYADQGKKLSVKGGGNFIWKDCFDILDRTKQSTVKVSTIIQPVNGKRRYGQDLPEHLQPSAKEAFDFEMESDTDL